MAGEQQPEIAPVGTSPVLAPEFGTPDLGTPGTVNVQYPQYPRETASQVLPGMNPPVVERNQTRALPGNALDPRIAPARTREATTAPAQTTEAATAPPRVGPSAAPDRTQPARTDTPQVGGRSLYAPEPGYLDLSTDPFGEQARGDTRPAPQGNGSGQPLEGREMPDGGRMTGGDKPGHFVTDTPGKRRDIQLIDQANPQDPTATATTVAFVTISNDQYGTRTYTRTLAEDGSVVYQCEHNGQREEAWDFRGNLNFDPQTGVYSYTHAGENEQPYRFYSTIAEIDSRDDPHYQSASSSDDQSAQGDDQFGQNQGEGQQTPNPNPNANPNRGRPRPGRPQDRATPQGQRPADAQPLPELDRTNFEQAVQNGITIVDIYQVPCGPCEEAAPMFHRLAEANQGVANAYQLDISTNQQTGQMKNPEIIDWLAQRGTNVSGTPTFVVLQNGRPVAAFGNNGSTEQDIQNTINQLRGGN